ncbi:unnamed protein product [Ceutorhynchus assimilis]|uniref:Uncharacterized protein n=1 Tax=Ceutorhynchus assimilis TaxID=467358 RepID=A0A9N9MVY3_9CUCU|nr:unnamed protein product [Ceutorhynchus assimilis]
MGITPGSDIMSMNINWGLVYELPNDTRPLLDIYKPAAKRRNRRDLYGRVEKILTVMGYDGRSCVLRSLCEAEHKLIHKEDSLTHKILNLIFHLMGLTPGIDLFSLNINWGLSWDLPNDTAPLLDAYKPAQKRRNRRELYGKVEKVLTSMGYDGRSCVLRSLCEAEHRFLEVEDSLGHNILSLIFRFPQETLLKNEPEIHHTYHYASQFGRSQDNVIDYSQNILDKCSETFKCPFSLIDLALGYYSLS